MSSTSASTDTSGKEDKENEPSCAACETIRPDLKRCCGSTYYCNAACQLSHRGAHKKVCMNRPKKKNRNLGVAKKAAVKVDAPAVAKKDARASPPGPTHVMPDGSTMTFEKIQEIGQHYRNAPSLSKVTTAQLNEMLDKNGVAVCRVSNDPNGDDDYGFDLDNFEFPPRPECPVCMRPFPLRGDQTTYMPCCGKLICTACNYESVNANLRSGIELFEASRCPMCRQFRLSGAKKIAAVRERAERGDMHSLFKLAYYYLYGEGVEKNVPKALELFQRAERKGLPEAAYCLEWYYFHGKIVDKDEKKAIQLLKRAAKAGHVPSFNRLGKIEIGHRENIGKGIRCLCIAASAGDEDALNTVRDAYKCGFATKADYAECLRAFQTSQEELRSDKRDEMHEQTVQKSKVPTLHEYNVEGGRKDLADKIGYLM